MQGLGGHQIDSGRQAVFLTVHALQINTATDTLQWVGQVHGRTEEQNHIPGRLEPLGGNVLGLFDNPNHRHRRRRIDGSQGTALIIEGNITPGDRCVEGPATLCQTPNRFFELPEDLGIVGVAEIKIVGRAHGDRSGTGQITAGLGDGGFSALVGIEIHVAPVAIDGEGDVLVGQGGRQLEPVGRTRLGCSILGLGDREAISLDANHGRIAAWADHRAIPNHVVVLTINPVLGGDGVIGKKAFEIAHRVTGVSNTIEAEGADTLHIGRLTRLALIHRSFVCQGLGREIHDHLAPMADDHAAGVGHHADFGPR